MKKISIILCVVLLVGNSMPPLAAVSMRPVAKWGGALAVLVAAGFIVGSSLKMKRLEKLKRSLSTASLKTLKGNQRWQNQLKLHALENSLETAQFYRSLGIAGVAVGGALAGAGFLWPKNEDGGVDPARQPLVPRGAGAPVDPDLDLAIRNSLVHESGRDGPGNSLVDSSLPAGAGAGFVSGGVSSSNPVLPKYVREKMYLVVPPTIKENVMPAKVDSIDSRLVRIVTVPGDGHCLLYSLLFFNWLKDHPGEGIPRNFALQAKQVLFMRTLICEQMQKKVNTMLQDIGRAVTLLSGEVDLSERLPYQFLINRVKDFYTCGVVQKFCSSGEQPSPAEFSFKQFQDCFDTAVLLKTFLAVSNDRALTFRTGLNLDLAPSDQLNVLEYVHFLMSPTCQGRLENIQKYLQEHVNVHELARSYMALYREHIACEVPVFPDTDIPICRNKLDAIREHLKQQVTVRQLADQYLEVYRQHIACPVPVFEGGPIPMPVDSQYYLGDSEAEFLARMFKTKIYVYYKNPSAGTYTHQKTYGSSLPPNSPIISLVNINSNHWAPLVVSGSVSVGAGAASGSSIE